MDKTEQMCSVKECAKVTGLPYGWLTKQVNYGTNPPPFYTLPGHKRRMVVPREVMEWAKERGKK